jgi:hypothetical protein
MASLGSPFKATQAKKADARQAIQEGNVLMPEWMRGFFFFACERARERERERGINGFARWG